jgi:hypothetical protein
MPDPAGATIDALGTTLSRSAYSSRDVSSRPFTIATDGDQVEQQWWQQWTATHFPSYETFWVSRTVPLTYRAKQRIDVRFQTTAELAAAGYTD